MLIARVDMHPIATRLKDAISELTLRAKEQGLTGHNADKQSVHARLCVVCREETVAPQLQRALVGLNDTISLLATSMDAVVFRKTWTAIAFAIHTRMFNGVVSDTRFSHQVQVPSSCIKLCPVCHFALQILNTCAALAV